MICHRFAGKNRVAVTQISYLQELGELLCVLDSAPDDSGAGAVVVIIAGGGQGYHGHR